MGHHVGAGSRRRAAEENLVRPCEYPRLVGYCEQLANGWDSSPDCLVRDLVVDAFRVRGVFDDLPRLPAPLASIARGPAPTGWVPEVAYAGLFLATRDARFPDASDRVYGDWWLQVGKERVDGDPAAVPLRDANVNATDPTAAALARVTDLWHVNHRGTRLDASLLGRTCAAVRLHHPASIFPSEMLQVYAKSIALVLVRHDLADPIVHVETTGEPRSAGEEVITTFFAEWS